MKHRVLVADTDELTAVSGLVSLISDWGYDVQTAADTQEAVEAARRFQPDVILAGLGESGPDGPAFVSDLSAAAPSATVLVLAKPAAIDAAVVAMRHGAYDYLTSPPDAHRLKILLEKALEHSGVLREVSLLRRQLQESRGLGPLLGTSAVMREIFQVIDVAAASHVPVLITGEGGTGKELAARTIHRLSPRHRELFVAVDCATANEALLARELCGHEAGAFMGAPEQRAGYLELAGHGTVFLDEVLELGPVLQAELLRILEEGRVHRVGGTAGVDIDVRIVAATSNSPLRAARENRLRADLYERLSASTLAMPPLRRRKEDIPMLVDAFIAEYAGKYDRPCRSVDPTSLKMLLHHGWPGNVRELRNVIERAVLACRDTLVTPKHFLSILPGASRTDPSDRLSLAVGTTVDEAERALILKTLASVPNKTRAARILGVSPKTLHNKLRRYGVTAAERVAVTTE